MKLLLILVSVLAFASVIEGGRMRRDITCASAGHTGCNMSCKMRGWLSGECSWNTETAAYNCNCSQERRGIRCNVGGENTCHISCLLLGHTYGECSDKSECVCSGENTRLGNMYETVAGRLRR